MNYECMSMIASCGLNCSGCAAYKATQAGNVEELAELAVKWGGNKGLKAEDMLCDGCTSDRVIKGALDCTVRSCAQSMGVTVCSQCGEYSCEKLEGKWKALNGDVDQLKSNLAKAK